MKQFMIAFIAALFLVPIQAEARGFKRIFAKCCKKKATKYCKKRAKRIRFKSKKAYHKWYRSCTKKAYKKCIKNKKHRGCLRLSRKKAARKSKAASSGSANRIICMCRGLGASYTDQVSCPNGSCRSCCRSLGWQDGKSKHH